MRRLGRPRAAATGTRGATVASLVALTLLLAGCGGADPSGSEDPSPSASPESTSPSADATPSVLKGGTRLEGPGFTLSIPPEYELIDRDERGQFSDWGRIYSSRKTTGSFISVSHITQSVLPIDEELENIRGFLISRGIPSDRIRRADDLSVVKHPTAHIIGTIPHSVETHSYLVDLGGSYLEVFFERAPDDARQERAQQAALASLQLTT